MFPGRFGGPMDSLEPEVRSAINSIHDELIGNGMMGTPAPSAPQATASSEGGRFVDSCSSKPHGATRNPEMAAVDPTAPKPVRGVVLEFATRMRQSRGREVALND